MNEEKNDAKYTKASEAIVMMRSVDVREKHQQHRNRAKQVEISG